MESKYKKEAKMNESLGFDKLSEGQKLRIEFHLSMAIYLLIKYTSKKGD